MSARYLAQVTLDEHSRNIYVDANRLTPEQFVSWIELEYASIGHNIAIYMFFINLPEDLITYLQPYMIPELAQIVASYIDMHAITHLFGYEYQELYKYCIREFTHHTNPQKIAAMIESGKPLNRPAHMQVCILL